MRKIILFSLIFVLSLTLFAYAQTTLKAEVDKLKITTDDMLTYKLVITSLQSNIPASQLPKFEGFNILSQARSSTASLLKNAASTIIVYTYILNPKEKGKLAIEPSTLKIKNSTISSEAFEIEVLEGKNKLKSPPEKFQPQSDKAQVTL